MQPDRPTGLLHPIALVAIAVLVINDHVLKARYPGWITGKLSDVAGLTFFPLLLCAIAMTCARRANRQRVLLACVIATAVGFAAVKLWSPATAACEFVLGALQWPFTAIASGSIVPVIPVSIVRDATDLIALPFTGVALLIARTRRDRG